MTIKSLQERTQNFLRKATIKHKNKYGYDCSEYISYHKKLKIRCFDHGIFEQSPSNHLSGHGCPMCAGRRGDLNQFINSLHEKHNFKFNYDNIKKVPKSGENITISCSKHGDFEMVSDWHHNGIGCSKCSGKFRYNTEAFIKRANEVHNFKYTYDDTVYTNSKSKIIVTCVLHGNFEQNASSHLMGHGCPYCAKEKTKYSDHKNSGEVYVVYLKNKNNGEEFIKVGVSKNTHKRMPHYTEFYKDIIIIKKYKKLSDAYISERDILNEIDEHKFTPTDKFGGHTECFCLSSLPKIKDLVNNS